MSLHGLKPCATLQSPRVLPADGSLRCGATFWGLGACATDRFRATSSLQRMSLMGRQLIKTNPVSMPQTCRWNLHPTFGSSESGHQEQATNCSLLLLTNSKTADERVYATPRVWSYGR